MSREFRRHFKTVAKFSSTCSRCGTAIKRGIDPVIYRPKEWRTAMCVECADDDPNVVYKLDEIDLRLRGPMPPPRPCLAQGCPKICDARLDFCPEHQSAINELRADLLFADIKGFS